MGRAVVLLSYISITLLIAGCQLKKNKKELTPAEPPPAPSEEAKAPTATATGTPSAPPSASNAPKDQKDNAETFPVIAVISGFPVGESAATQLSVKVKGDNVD
ncbi:MAG: hypothetical protein HQK54_12295, partial [Oligoflexales bacterium]|nr:hypothetical protein [Oligoflexales bacterium]